MIQAKQLVSYNLQLTDEELDGIDSDVQVRGQITFDTWKESLTSMTIKSVPLEKDESLVVFAAPTKDVSRIQSLSTLYGSSVDSLYRKALQSVHESMVLA